jgi:hypothetical protein
MKYVPVVLILIAKASAGGRPGEPSSRSIDSLEQGARATVELEDRVPSGQVVVAAAGGVGRHIQSHEDGLTSVGIELVPVSIAGSDAFAYHPRRWARGNREGCGWCVAWIAPRNDEIGRGNHVAIQPIGVPCLSYSATEKAVYRHDVASSCQRMPGNDGIEATGDGGARDLGWYRWRHRRRRTPSHLLQGSCLGWQDRSF